MKQIRKKELHEKDAEQNESMGKILPKKKIATKIFLINFKNVVKIYVKS